MRITPTHLSIVPDASHYRHRGSNIFPYRPAVPPLTPREDLASFGEPKPTLKRYRRSGRVQFSKVGANVFYKKEHLDALLENAAVRGGIAR